MSYQQGFEVLKWRPGVGRGMWWWVLGVVEVVVEMVVLEVLVEMVVMVVVGG